MSAASTWYARIGRPAINAEPCVSSCTASAKNASAFSFISDSRLAAFFTNSSILGTSIIRFKTS